MSNIETTVRHFEMHTRWFNNALDGISEEDGLKRIDGKGNHLCWVAGHLLMTRYSNAKRMGLPVEEFPHVDIYAIRDMPPPNARGLDPELSYPELADIRRRWQDYSGALIGGLARLTEEDMKGKMPFQLPIGGDTMLDFFAFITSHEAYHIGQMSLLRKQLGYQPMTLR